VLYQLSYLAKSLLIGSFSTSRERHFEARGPSYGPTLVRGGLEDRPRGPTLSGAYETVWGCREQGHRLNLTGLELLVQPGARRRTGPQRQPLTLCGGALVGSPAMLLY
jgi:hypothetical protein